MPSSGEQPIEISQDQLAEYRRCLNAAAMALTEMRRAGDAASQASFAATVLQMLMRELAQVCRGDPNLINHALAHGKNMVENASVRADLQEAIKVWLDG